MKYLILLAFVAVFFIGGVVGRVTMKSPAPALEAEEAFLSGRKVWQYADLPRRTDLMRGHKPLFYRIHGFLDPPIGDLQIAVVLVTDKLDIEGLGDHSWWLEKGNATGVILVDGLPDHFENREFFRSPKREEE